MINNTTLKHAMVWAIVLICAPAQAQQTCNDNMAETAPESRFTINANETVTDQATGLIWKRCLQGLSGTDCAGSVRLFNWQQALSEAQGEIFATQDDWRLPNIKELSSIVERACAGPAINLTVFPNEFANSRFVWSGSPVSGRSDSAWAVQFFSGFTAQLFRNDGGGVTTVRLVRGGQ